MWSPNTASTHLAPDIGFLSFPRAERGLDAWPWRPQVVDMSLSLPEYRLTCTAQMGISSLPSPPKRGVLCLNRPRGARANILQRLTFRCPRSSYGRREGEIAHQEAVGLRQLDTDWKKGKVTSLSTSRCLRADWCRSGHDRCSLSDT